MKFDKMINVKMEGEMHRQFKMWCAKNQVNYSDVIRSWIRELLENDRG